MFHVHVLSKPYQYISYKDSDHCRRILIYFNYSYSNLSNCYFLLLNKLFAIIVASNFIIEEVWWKALLIAPIILNLHKQTMLSQQKWELLLMVNWRNIFVVTEYWSCIFSSVSLLVFEIRLDFLFHIARAIWY